MHSEYMFFILSLLSKCLNNSEASILGWLHSSNSRIVSPLQQDQKNIAPCWELVWSITGLCCAKRSSVVLPFWILGRGVIPVLEHTLLFINFKPDILGSKSSINNAETRRTETCIRYAPWFPQSRWHAQKIHVFFHLYAKFNLFIL